MRAETSFTGAPLSAIAHELVEGIRRDSTVDWADREATEARIRARIKRLLWKHAYKPRRLDAGGGDHHELDHAAQLPLDRAKALYRYWPEVEVGDRLFLG